MNLDAVADTLRSSTRATVERNFPLAALTSYRLGGAAALYVEPSDATDVKALGAALRGAGLDRVRVPILTLGRGSNVLISDDGWPGIAVRLGPAFSWIRAAADEANGMEAGGSTAVPLLANWAARRALTGLEFAVAIPGSVGGAVRMNAGAHDASIGDRLVVVAVFDLDELEVLERSVAELELGYRKSNLTERQVVLEARFRLEPGDEQAIKVRMDSFRRHRAATQPGALSNAGSVFKNPPGDSAGRLVEAAGLKGFRVGDAWVSDLHANFFMAGSSATAQDVFDLIREVQRRVRAQLGVDLEPEVRFVGSFREGARS